MHFAALVFVGILRPTFLPRKGFVQFLECPKCVTIRRWRWDLSTCPHVAFNHRTRNERFNLLQSRFRFFVSGFLFQSLFSRSIFLFVYFSTTPKTRGRSERTKNKSFSRRVAFGFKNSSGQQANSNIVSALDPARGGRVKSEEFYLGQVRVGFLKLQFNFLNSSWNLNFLNRLSRRFGVEQQTSWRLLRRRDVTADEVSRENDLNVSTKSDSEKKSAFDIN